MKEVRWGIIGCGEVTEKKSGPAFNEVEGSHVEAVFSRNETKARSYAERHHVRKWYTDPQELILDPDINAIYVATPPAAHTTFAIMSMRAGKPCYVEKPLAASYEDCIRINHISEQTGVRCYVAYYRRYLPYFKKVKTLINSGVLGKIMTVQVRLIAPPKPQDAQTGSLPWRLQSSISGGGYFYDLAPHQIDLLQDYFGIITKAHGYKANRGGLYAVEDTVNAVMEFESGLTASGAWCFCAHESGRDDRIEVFGSKGRLAFSVFTHQTLPLYTTEGVQEIDIPRPSLVQLPIIRSVVEDIQGIGTCDCDSFSATPTNWALDRLLGKVYPTNAASPSPYQLSIIALLSVLIPLAAYSLSGTASSWSSDSTVETTRRDTIAWMRPPVSETKQNEKSWLKHNIRKLNKVDTTYIEPQRYNYAFMIQNTNTYELYRIKSNLGYSVTFAPNMSLRVGPYFGYRWIFIGYTIDVTHLYDEVNDRTDFNLSLYSNKIGLDLYYRKTGDGYYIRNSYFGDDFNTEPLRDVKFGGVTTSNKGFNAYYIFNHRKFSYPAAFSQSTVQRRSAGSPLIGIGYSNQNVTVDWRALDDLIASRTGRRIIAEEYDSTRERSTFHYDDINISGGYAYNWVFARNWLLDASLCIGLSYKKTRSDVQGKWLSFRDFTAKNLNLDGTFRFAVVYNNMRWYSGMSIVTHAFKYRCENFETENLFGTLNVYVGFNFGHKYKKKNHKGKKK